MFRITAYAGALLCLLMTGVIPAYAETCIASQYGVGDGYHGKRTASGAIFNTYATSPYTVAHKTRALGSFVMITNHANGRSIHAKVTDRGPFIAGRCVDLGRAGANALGMGGTARVSVN
jgi:rare lipoprotein A